MLIQHEVSPYNTRRYLKPWAAQITFDGTKPMYNFTGLYSNHILAFDAELGDIVAIGQKDTRGGNTSNDWYVVREQGLSYLTGGKVEALQLWRERKERETEAVIEQNRQMLAARDEINRQTPERLLEVQAALVVALEKFTRPDDAPVTGTPWLSEIDDDAQQVARAALTLAGVKGYSGV